MKKRMYLLLLLGLTLCVVGAMPLLMLARQSAMKSRCHANLFQIYTGVWTYDEVHHELPPPVLWSEAEQRDISWRTFTLPYYFLHDSGFEQSYADLEHQFDRRGTERYFRCPGTGKPSDSGITQYLAVTGDRTVWGDEFRTNLYERLPDDVDKILLMETTREDIPWNSTTDLNVDEAVALWAPKPEWRGGGTHTGLGYMTVRGKYGLLSDFKSEEKLREMIEFSNEEIELMNRPPKPETPEPGTAEPQLGI